MLCCSVCVPCGAAVCCRLLSTSTQDTHTPHSPHTAHKLHTLPPQPTTRPMPASGRRLALPGTYRGLGARPHQGRARLVAADLGQMVLRRLDIDDGDVGRPRLWVRRGRHARGVVGGLVYSRTQAERTNHTIHLRILSARTMHKLPRTWSPERSRV